MEADFRERVQSYLSRKLALNEFAITALEQIAGAGLSRSVIRVTASVQAPQHAHRTTQSYILLMTDPASPVPPNRMAEYFVLRNLSAHSRFPVPHAYCMEESTEALGRPFLVTSLLPGVASPKHLLQPQYLSRGKAIARQSFELLGTLAALDSDAVNLGSSLATPHPSDVHTVELERIEKILREQEATNMPVTSAGLRRLRRAIPPPPPKISVVHGDFRIGNYLFDEAGITGIIDWEMVHKGDPLEDLAWALLPNWEFASRPGLTAGYLTRDEVIAAWQTTSGLEVDRDALEWWLLFCHIKAVSIWSTARHSFFSGQTNDLLMALAGYLVPKQESYIAGMLKGVR